MNINRMKRIRQQIKVLWLLSSLSALFFVTPLFAQDTVIFGPSVLQATATRNLLNGLRIEILSASQYPRVAMHLLIGAGSTLDPMGKAGLADLTMATLIESVPDWQGEPSEIGQIMEAGQKFRYEVDWDSTHLYVECAPQEVGIYLQSLTRFVRFSTLSAAKFEETKKRMLSGLSNNPLTARQRTERKFDSEMFLGNPYSRPLSGNPTTLENISYGDVVAFQRKYHLPNVSVLSVVGPVNADEIRQSAGRYLGTWIMDEKFPFTFTPPVGNKQPRLIVVEAPPTKEIVLTVGQMSIPRTSGEFVQAELLARILSRMRWDSLSFKPVIELPSRRLRGFLRTTMQTSDVSLLRILRDVRQEWSSLVKDGPDPELFSREVQSYLQELQKKAGSALTLARMLCEIDTYQVGFNYYERIKQMLPKMTPAELHTSARKLLTPDQLLAVAAGPVTTSDLEELKKDGWQVIVQTAESPQEKK